jgi:glucose/arabinose dehydrogenase
MTSARDPRWPRSVALAILVAVLVAACGGPADATPDGGVASPIATSAPSPSAPASATPTPAPTTAGPVDRQGPIDLELVADGLTDPVDVAVHPRDPAAMLIAEQIGRIQVVRDGAIRPDPFLDIAGVVTAGGEQGLLGVAPHPDPADDRVFVYYTAIDGRQIVSSFRLDPDDPDRLMVDSEVFLLRMDDRFGNHNGGALAFGPDGFLYIGTGDGGGAGDPLDSGRDLTSLLAKILRIDVDAGGDEPYGIPADNPYADGADGRRPEIWATGMRNPWRIRFDPATGDLWVGDVGQGSFEEIDIVPAGVGGLDFGWNVMEGAVCFRDDACDEEGLVLPVAAYDHDEGCSVTGGSVYRGTAQPALAGRYVYADYCSGRFWTLDTEVEGAEPVVVLDSSRRISAVAPGPDGELFATDLTAGELLRVVAAD